MPKLLQRLSSPAPRQARWRLGVAFIVSAIALVAARGQPSVYPPPVPAADNSAGRIFAKSTARLPVYFSPPVPVLGTPFIGPVPVDLRLLAPPELAPYRHEFFYAALSTLLAERKLASPLAERLASYLLLRRVLEQELRSCLSETVRVEPAPREEALRKLVERQAPRLRELEETAELLRHDFIEAGTDWSALRRKPVSYAGNPTEEQAASERAMLRATAYYQEGLELFQRELLDELSAELGEPESAATATPWLTTNQRIVGWLDPGARVPLPVPLPDSIQRRFVEIEATKSMLKAALRDTAGRMDLGKPADRVAAWQELARTQAKIVAALEPQLQKLRRDLLREGIFPRAPPPLALGSDFATRFDHYRAECRTLRTKLGTQIEAIRRRYLAYMPRDQTPVVTIVPWQFDPPTSSGLPPYLGMSRVMVPRHLALGMDGIDGEVRDVVVAFRRTHRRPLEAVAADREALVKTLADLTKGPPTAAEQLLDRFVAMVDSRDGWLNYEEYRLAVFEPGLSPPQRRLLLGMTLERLAMPLPGGEFQPVD